MSTDEDTARDLELALEYLRGKVTSKGGVDRTTFRQTPESRRASRAAIARLLELPHPPAQLLSTLARLFDDDFDGMTSQGRTLVLKGRRKGPPRDAAKDVSLIVEIKRLYLTGMSLEAAIAEVADQFGMSEGGLWDIWNRNPTLRELVLSSIPRK